MDSDAVRRNPDNLVNPVLKPPPRFEGFTGPDNSRDWYDSRHNAGRARSVIQFPVPPPIIFAASFQQFAIIPIAPHHYSSLSR